MSCVVCGCEPASFESVIVAGIGQHCFRCYNQDVARRMGVEFDNSSLAPVTLNDTEGVPHHFEIRSRLVPTGHVMEAIEIRKGQPRGYRFSVLGDFDADALTLFTQLYERMRAGLAVRHVRHGELGWQLTKDEILSGRIEADLEDDLGMPILVIDGKEFRWDEVGRMLMTFEGFTVDIRIRDTIDVVGGPLLDEGE
jgi:hypothetical protein